MRPSRHEQVKRIFSRLGSCQKQPALTEAVKDGGKAGLPYETVENMKDVEQLDKLGNANALVLAKGTLTAVALP